MGRIIYSGHSIALEMENAGRRGMKNPSPGREKRENRVKPRERERERATGRNMEVY